MSAPDVLIVAPGALAGTVAVPGDKSISHRAVLLGALADGAVAISGLSSGADVTATIRAVEALGARVEPVPDGRTGVVVTGRLAEPQDVLDCGNSGTTLRLLSGVVAALPGAMTVLTGDASLRRRPVARVVAPLRAMGAGLSARSGDRHPPLVVHGARVQATTWTQLVASAQVKSAVLLAGLAAEGRTTVRSPRGSRDHTERMLVHLGADVSRQVDDDGAEIVSVEGGRLSGRPVSVPGDPSSAACWHVAAAIGGGRVATPGICVNPTRTGALRVLEALGARVETGTLREVTGEPVADVTVTGPLSSSGTELAGDDVVDALDELPLLALAGACAGGVQVRDAAELRVKESDRIAGTAGALRALGLVVQEHEDGFLVPGGQRPRGGEVHANGDHRIAMLGAVAGTVADAPVTVGGAGAIATSYPGFAGTFMALGGHAHQPDTA